MNEELITALVRLFAVLTASKVSADVRGTLSEFLTAHLTERESSYYLGSFEEFRRQPHQQAAYTPEEINKITAQVSAALTQQQRTVLLISIVDLLNSTEFITEAARVKIEQIAASLKLNDNNTNQIIRFVVGEDMEELSSPHILIIDEGQEPMEADFPRLIRNNLTGLIAILKIPGAEIYFVKYLGISQLFLNASPMQSRLIEPFPTGSSVRGTKIDTIYYSEIISQFLSGSGATSIAFNAQDVCFHFPNGKRGLLDINIAESGGKLIGLMGASGSGKSTLLNVLNGMETPSSGHVTINGIDVHKQADKLEGVIGFIPQDDLLIEELSVKQNLYYAAKLCFSQKPEEEILALLDKVILNLGLSEIQDLRVGSVMDKTISGGQRKRVNIGLELLREPQLLFVDEPTSGLSSRDSENIMDLLKELSLRGKMIFVVIHQPSSNIFKMFDSLVIMDTGGFQVYYGNPIDAITYFQQAFNKNSKSQGECIECGNVNPEYIFDIIETRVINEYGRLTEERKIPPSKWNEFFREKLQKPKIDPSTAPIEVNQVKPRWIEQLKQFFLRDLQTKISNKQYILINSLEAPILAAFIAYLIKYYQEYGVTNPEYTFYNNENIPVFYFMSVVVVLFFGLTMSAEEIFRDRKLLKRESFLHLSRSSYLTSKISILFIISAIQSAAFFVVGNLMLEIPLTEYRFWLILFSTSCFANMLGLNISATFNSAVTIYILIPFLLIPQLLLSGVVVNFDKFNPRISDLEGVPLIGEVMVSRWAFEAYMVSQFKDNPVGKMFYEPEKELANVQYKLIYYLPVLDTKAEFCKINPQLWENGGSKNFDNALAVLKNELSRELFAWKGKELPYAAQLAVGKFNNETLESVTKDITELKAYYNDRMKKAIQAKDDLTKKLTDTPEKMEAYRAFRNKYQNESVTDAVKSVNTANRIIELDGELHQHIYPIYFDDHRPAHLFDFSANFYTSTKHFLGVKFDTYYFNIAVIWTMTCLLYIMLYNEVLKKVLRIS